MGSFTTIKPRSTKELWGKTATGGTFTDLATGKVITKDPVPTAKPAGAASQAETAAPKAKAKRESAGAAANRAEVGPSAQASAPSPSKLGTQYQEALGRAVTAPASPSRILRTPQKPQSPVNRSGYSAGQGILDVFKKGANQFAQAGASTLALAEDVINAPFELFSGMELGSLRNSGEGIFNPLREKVQAEGTALAEKSAENVRKGGAVAAALDKVGTATVAAVPQAVLAMLTGGSSAAAQAAARTTGGAARTAASSLSPGITQTIRNVVGKLARDPQYWSSFSQVVGSGYQQALEDGASMPKAALYAVGNGLMNAAVEVGGGVETLPGELQAGASGWRALVDSALDEGKEEVIQGVIERAMQNLTYQKGNPLASVRNPDAVFNPLTAAEEFAGGAVVGGILSGGQIAVQSGVNAYAQNQIQKQLELMERAAGLRENVPGGTQAGSEAAPGLSGGTDTTQGANGVTEASEARQRQEAGNQLLELMRQVQQKREAEQQKAAQTDPLMEAARRGGRLEMERIRADTSLFDRSILQNLNNARSFFVDYAKKHFPASVVNTETGKEIGISRTGIDKFLSGRISAEKYASGFHIPELVRQAVKVSEAGNYHEGQRQSIPTFEYYDSPIEIEGKPYMAHIRVRNTLMGDRYYGHTVSEVDGIEIEPSARTSDPVNPAVQPVNAIDSSKYKVAQGTENVKPGIMERELQRLFGGGKRLSPKALTAEQMAAVEAANNAGTVDMDAENRLYQVNPEEHIDRRDIQSSGDKRVRAFQFDHPQLHPYYVRAAETLAAELEHYIPGGGTASRVSEDGNVYSYRMGRSATPRIAELIDRYGVKPAQIGNAIEAIIQDGGQENYAAAKRLELLLDDMLTSGYQDALTGEFVAPNQEYISMKQAIPGAADAQANPGSILDGLGAADAGFTTRGMEGKERTSRMAESNPYNKTQEAATAMTREEYDRLFRYQSQTEAKTTHLAEELVYVLQDGKKTFLKDVDEAAYDALKESLQEATAWNAEQAEAAKMIELELLGRSYNGEITSEEYTDWMKTVREHGTSTGQGIQAFAKWTRTDNNRGQKTTDQAVETIQNSSLSDAQKWARIQEVLDLTNRINNVEEGDIGRMEDIILEISKERGTTTGPVAKRLDGVLRKAMDGLTFQELKQFAFSSVEALSTDTAPIDMGDAIKTIQVLNMLSSLKTPGRNLTGNTAFYGLDALSMDGAALLDMALSNVTGTRSVAMGGSPINQAMWENAIKSAKMSTLETALDIDMGSGETMYGPGGQRTFRAGAQHEGKAGKALSFTERVLSALERNNSFLLTVPDEFFKGIARGNEVNIQRLIDQGKIKTKDANYAAKQADALAKYRTFQDTNAASAISTGIHDLLNLIGKGDSGKKIKGLTVHSAGLGDFVSPFSRVAANLAARGVDYNPVTAFRGVVEMGSILYDVTHGKTIDPARQAEAVSRTARGISGTAVIGAFLGLLSAGLIRRADDEGDENVAALNRSEGRTGYQFNLSAARRWMDGESQKWQNGDKLLDISSLQPFNELLGVAEQIYQDEGKSPSSLLKDDFLGMMYAAADIPVIQTVGDLGKDLILYKKDPTDAFAEAFVNTAVSSVTPNLLRSIATGLDDRPRSINREDGLWQLIQDEAKSRVPGLRQTLPSSVDPTGADKTYPGSRVGHFLNSTVNPLGLNTYEQSEQSQEWQRLREETGRTDFYPSSRIPKKLEGQGLSKDLSYEQRQEFQRQRGLWMMSTTMQMMGLSGYKSAGSEQQSDLMKAVRDFSHEAAKAGVLGLESVPKWVSQAIDAQKNAGLSPAEYILYKQFSDRDGSGSVSQAESSQTLMEMDLTNEQRGQAWSAMNNKGETEEARQRKEAKNPFTGAMAQEGFDPEEALKFWQIYDGTGTKEDLYTKQQKQEDVMEALGLSSRMEAISLWNLMEKSLK